MKHPTVGVSESQMPEYRPKKSESREKIGV
jgi:hypothetical protein